MISRKAEIQTLAVIFTLSAIPLITVLWVVSATTRADLSDLTPIQNSSGDTIVLNWSILLQEQSHSRGRSTPPANHRVRALGYMVDGAKTVLDGAWVEDFVLLPDASNLLHPAHRFGDQMITVQLKRNSRVPFFARSLVWVTGTLHTIPGDPIGEEPLYRLDDAHSEPAKTEEIRRYFY